MEDYENYMSRVNSIKKINKQQLDESNREDKNEDQAESQEDEGDKKKYFFSELQWELITAFIGISLAVGMTVAIIVGVHYIFR